MGHFSGKVNLKDHLPTHLWPFGVKYSFLPQRKGLTEKRNVIIGYVHLEIKVECAQLSKVYVSTDSTIDITVGYWAVFVIAIPYLTAYREPTENCKQGNADRNKVNREFWPDANILHGKDVPLKSWIYKFENWL